MEQVKKWLTHPVSLFFIIGILIFFVYSRISNFFDQRERQIVVSPERIALLEETFTKTWNRSPTPSEMEKQVENYIRDEVFYREAVNLGLDKSDPAIKKRLRQLLELMLDEYADVYPSEDQLNIYLSENADKFMQNARISFRHLYFPSSQRQEAVDLLPGLLDGSISTGGSQLMMVPDYFENETDFEIENTFGKSFSAEIFQLNVGSWQGPIQSGYGWHLVKIDVLQEGVVPPLNEIWDAVEREWSFERRQKVKEEQYMEMRKNYQIEVIRE